MSKSQINFRLPNDLISTLKDQAEKADITVTEMVIKLLQQGLGLTTSTPGQMYSNQLEKRIANLEQRLTTVELQLTRSEIAPQKMSKPEKNKPAKREAESLDSLSKEDLESAKEAEQEIEILNLRELCDLYSDIRGMSYSNIHRTARNFGQSLEEFILERTGDRWIQVGFRQFERAE